ncbi:BglG family transcription antiterminator [Bacillus sp. BRMEA1]|nr:BglG family transcription antiterminator [Neobacillus endophyticus]
MYISARERQLLEILLSKTDEITVKNLSDQIGVSERTIHRDLKNVEDILKEYDLSLEKKSGVGVYITGDENKIRELEFFLFNLSHNEYTPDERQTIILCELLESNGPVKLLGLANDLNVTIATVSADLSKLEEKLTLYGLSLIRKRGYGVEIEGDEGAKRRAMSSLISEYLDESELLSLTRENIQKRSTQQINTISERLMGLVEKRKLVIVEKIVESVVQELPFSMADSAFIGLVVHLALAVERIQKGEGITIDPSYLIDQQLTKEYKFAEKMVAELEQIFQITIPEAEIAYITMHLKGAKLRHDNEYLIEDSSLQVAIKTKNLIVYIGKQAGIDLNGNRSLFEGLILHLKPALYRIKQRMGISNPLLDKIKRDYAELFLIVKEAMQQVFFEFHVPDEEIGYIVMHFGAALLGNREAMNLKTVVICSSGIGTSKLLATKLQKEFPELTQVENISLLEFKKMKKNRDYQIVISTIPIPDEELEYVVVSPFLTNDDSERIRSYINQYKIAHGSVRNLPIHFHHKRTRKKASALIKEMQSLQDYANTIAIILEGFEMMEQSKCPSIEDMLREICMYLSEKQTVEQPLEVAKALLERETLGGLGIPGTAMALYHARSAHVLKPSFSIHVLSEPIETAGMDGNVMQMRFLVLMLSPLSNSDKGLEVLSLISTMLIESEETTAIFQSNHKEKIEELLATRFDQFFNDKLTQLRSE